MWKNLNNRECAAFISKKRLCTAAVFFASLHFFMTQIHCSNAVPPLPPRLGGCSWNPEGKSMRCSRFRTSNSTKEPGDNFMKSFFRNVAGSGISTIISEVEEIYVDNSFIPALNLNQFHTFRSLKKLSVVDSHVSVIWGSVLKNLKFLNVSGNTLRSQNFSSTMFPPNSEMQILDISYNKLDQLPNVTMQLNLTHLYIAGNEIRCNWVTRPEFYDWATNNEGVIQNIDATFCLSDRKVFAKMTIESGLKVRKAALEECEEMNKHNCGCDIYTTKVIEPGEDASVFQHVRPIDMNKYGTVYMTLEVDCSNLGLTDLPHISPLVFVLNLDNNKIRDLSRLNSDDYINVHSIKLNQNLVESLEAATETEFFDRVQVFEMRTNSLSRIQYTTINSIFTKENGIRRIDRILIGENTIHCDCNSFNYLRPTLVTHESIIKDWKTLRCKSPNVTLHDLKFEEACEIEGTEMTDRHWWIIIGIEAFLITIILIKLWTDWREYRRTRKLPGLSNCMPRLPCDFMLERIEDSRGHHLHHIHHNHKTRT